MNLEELKKDLDSKYRKNGYIKVKLFKKDKSLYRRRSFDDLFKYYRRKKVTEKLLLQALVECKICGLVCTDINKIVFFRLHKIGENTYLSENTPPSYGYAKDVKDSKYTIEYLNKLYDSIY